MRDQHRSSKLDARSPDDCRWRIVGTSEGREVAHCQFLQQVFGVERDEICVVNRGTCEACCKTFPPTFEALNPVIASLVFDRAEGITGEATLVNEVNRRHMLRRWAEQQLEIDVPALPRPSGSQAGTLRQRARVLTELVPPPPHRCGELVQHWAVGVTTAPRRHSHLDECLESLAQAGWPRPHLFIDGAINLSSRWAHLPATSRDEQTGAWPNYYLSLLELLMREPLADAFLMVQDDALFYCRENVRQYLEKFLWPGDTPGIVSLYCATPDVQESEGWFRYRGRWKYSSVAFIFPRKVAQQMLIAKSVFHHRWAGNDDGRVGIPDVIADWAEATSTPMYFPNPSLVDHIGETSAIWLSAYELQPNRCANRFIGDSISAPNPEPSIRNYAAAEFPESEFRCDAAHEAEYRMRVTRGLQRMADASAVICGLCRDVAPHLPATIPRIERLAGLFRRCSVVIVENDSVDKTPELLRQWAHEVPEVYVESERLEQPRIHGTCRQRTERMAFYRNRCREHVLANFGMCDFVVVADMDLDGWSYEGIANTFGQDGWDFVGSNGLSFDSPGVPESIEYVDVFAYRTIGQLRTSGKAHYLRFARGEPMVPVWSCFGGLGVYRMECFTTASYGGDDCEHVTLHRALRERGLDRLFLNPSQIVLYPPRSTGS